jgi:hypothetical protein
MKLLLCEKCNDIFKLDLTLRQCKCGAVKGKYLDEINAVYSGGYPIGFSNPSLVKALLNQPERGLGSNFTAFVIPKDCPTMVKKENLN